MVENIIPVSQSQFRPSSTGGAPISSAGSTTQGTSCLCPVMLGIPAQQAQPPPELMAKVGEELKTLHPFCSILWQRLFELETFGRRFPPFAVSVCGWTQHHHLLPL